VADNFVDSRPIEELEALDRSRLYLFVVGPEVGEGLALALPASGWLFVDACRVGDSLPQLEIFKRLAQPSENVTLVLTHPHADHADGFADLVERIQPNVIAVTGTSHPATDLLQAVKAILEREDAAGSPTSRKEVARAVKSAVEAIRGWERRTGRRTIPLCDGGLLESLMTHVHCCAPDETGATALLSGNWPLTVEKANHLSTVLAIRYGGTLVVLGGDLPRFESNALEQRVPTGWDAVLERHPSLSKHTGLKVPHHGFPVRVASSAARAARREPPRFLRDPVQPLMPAGSRRRGWFVSAPRARAFGAPHGAARRTRKAARLAAPRENFSFGATVAIGHFAETAAVARRWNRYT
jgi:hypothetical protein